MNNKILGNKFEKDFANFIAKKGYWVHYIERFCSYRFSTF